MLVGRVEGDFGEELLGSEAMLLTPCFLALPNVEGGTIFRLPVPLLGQRVLSVGFGIGLSGLAVSSLLAGAWFATEPGEVGLGFGMLGKASCEASSRTGWKFVVVLIHRRVSFLVIERSIRKGSIFRIC